MATMVEAETQSFVQFIDHLKQNMADGLLVINEKDMAPFTNSNELDQMNESLIYMQRMAGWVCSPPVWGMR
ncbi:MAG: hypothetical protein HC804_06285 [Anaerolineae bacterium]|nr:hypothetical protein [Anaerolineae bacterium]